MTAIKQLNLLLSFLLELAMLFLYGYCGFTVGETPVLKYVFGVLLPGLVIVLWWLWAAPKAKRRLKNPSRSILKISLFLLASFLCFEAGQPIWAIWFGVITLMNAGLAFIFLQDY